MAGLLGDELVDVLETEAANQTLRNLAVGKYPWGYRSKWKFGDEAAIAAAATALRAAWKQPDEHAAEQPLMAYFLREYLEYEAPGATAPRMLALLELLPVLMDARDAADARTPKKLLPIVASLERLAPDGSDSRPAARSRVASIGNALRSAARSLSLSSVAAPPEATRVLVGDRAEGGPSGLVLEDGAGAGRSGGAGASGSAGADAWASVALRLRSLVHEVEVAAEARRATVEGEVVGAVREALALASAALHAGCAPFVSSPSFHPGPVAKFYSLLQCAVGDSAFVHVRPLGPHKA